MLSQMSSYDNNNKIMIAQLPRKGCQDHLFDYWGRAGLPVHSVYPVLFYSKEARLGIAFLLQRG
jgi:hypothetical protein